MNKFTALFGVEPEKIKKTCVLMPFVFKDALKRFGAGGFAQGKLYACAEGGGFSVVRSGMGAGLAGDAVLYLKETPCREVILFGSCGLFTEKDGLSSGSLVTASGCYSAESFTGMLSGRGCLPGIFTPDGEMLDLLLKMPKRAPVVPVHCLTLASLKLEEERAADLTAGGVKVADMECSAFYSAAASCGLKALSLFYVSDIIDKKPFYAQPGADELAKTACSRELAAGIICDLVRLRSGV